MAMKTIVLRRTVRILHRPQPLSLQLHKVFVPGTAGIQVAILQGERVTIGDPMQMVYDHRLQLVVPVLNQGMEHTFFLLEELLDLVGVS
jgi:hypothetical protein